MARLMPCALAAPSRGRHGLWMWHRFGHAISSGMEGVTSVVGVDVSARSLEHATHDHGSPSARFLTFSEYQPDGTLDLAFCNGVFHHIPPADRAAAIRFIGRSLRPGGLFALWENNPWNPGTRYVMSRIPFDRDAIMLTPGEARDLVRANGFERLSNRFPVYLPAHPSWASSARAIRRAPAARRAVSDPLPEALRNIDGRSLARGLSPIFRGLARPLTTDRPTERLSTSCSCCSSA